MTTQTSSVSVLPSTIKCIPNLDQYLAENGSAMRARDRPPLPGNRHWVAESTCPAPNYGAVAGKNSARLAASWVCPHPRSPPRRGSRPGNSNGPPTCSLPPRNPRSSGGVIDHALWGNDSGQVRRPPRNPHLPAEAEGFEPPVLFRHARFQGECIRPLCHASLRKRVREWSQGDRIGSRPQHRDPGRDKAQVRRLPT